MRIAINLVTTLPDHIMWSTCILFIVTEHLTLIIVFYNSDPLEFNDLIFVCSFPDLRLQLLYKSA